MIPLLPDPLGDYVKDQATQIAGDWLVDLANKAGQSAQMTLEKTATFWVTGIKSPQLTQATDEGAYTPANTVAYLWERLDWYVAGLAVLSIFVAAGKMAWQRNGAPFWELLQSILTMIVVSSAGVATISLLTSASDQAASYILKDALTKPGDPPSNFQAAFASMFTTPAATPATAFVLVGLLALVLIASVVQIVLLIIRGGMLFLLAGVLPLAAAATNTEVGRQWFRKTVAWVIAFLLYKPVAAIVYATAFQLTRTGGAAAPTAGDDIIKVITGLTMCVLALFALPALMRFTVPAVATAAGSGGGGAGLALGGALAMGAKNALTKSSSSGGGGGGGGKSGPPSKPPTQSEGSSGGDSGPKGSSVAPSGGQLAGQSTATQTATKKAAAAAAGPAGAVATAVADGLKKVNESANSAVSQAAGEDAPPTAPGRSSKPGNGNGKSPASGPSKTTTAPAKTPPTPPAPPPPPPPSSSGKGPSGSEAGKQTPSPTSTPPPASTSPAGGGPSGSQSGKPTPPTPAANPPTNPPAPPSTTEGPSGGKRK